METKLDYDDVLIRPRRSPTASRSKVVLEREFKFYHSPREWSGVPIICSNMSCVAGIEMARALNKHKIVTCLHKYLSVDELGSFFQKDGSLDYNWVSIGYKETEIDKLEDLFRRYEIYPNICIDVPNGYMDTFVDFCKKVRINFPDSIIMAGNVCTEDMTQELIIHGGVDIVKLQIGPGSACRTRMMTGVGYGTFSCVKESSKAAHGLKTKERCLGLVCADGGCKHPGDVCKALCSGADFVMLGGFFGGTKESCGDWELDEKGNKKNLVFYGMSTHHAQKKHDIGKRSYRASEGDILKIPYKGPVDNVVQELLGGIRSCCAYIGANRTKDMSKCASFIKVNKIHDNFYKTVYNYV